VGEVRGVSCGSAAAQESFVVSARQKKRILGIGLDGKDKSVRVTRGGNFHLVGGSQETHEDMQEKCIKLNEKLKARGKELEDLGRREFLELAAECRMTVVEPEERK
jgi:hypothetical protein